MNILGVNSGRAAPPRVDPTKIRRLADGSAALLKDGRICCASIEERLARVRYAPGFRESSLACIANGKLTLGAIDAIGHSTCCDIAWSDPGDLLDDIADTWEGIYSRTAICEALGGKVFTVDHHESHAALAFVGSGFRRALVAVIDGMGNRYGVPGEFNVSEDWWRGAFQRHDYYLCEWRNGRLRIEKVHEDAHREGEIGLGEIYRSVTHFLGWPTYQHAGKTMALAAYGRPERLDRARLIDFVAPFSTHVPVPSLHRHPITQIGDAIRKGGYRLPDLSAGKGTPQNAFLCDVAALVQHQLETALASGVIALAEKFGTTNIALGGGVAMN